MLFVHSPIDLGYGDLYADTSPGGRFYSTPSGVNYPSITTVLGIRNKGYLQEWRARVGAEEANRVSRRASSRGSTVHTLLERFINNEAIDERPLMPNVRNDFRNGCKILRDSLGKVLLQEAPLFSDHLGVAGRVDLVAEFDRKVSIIDFKTSSRVKTREDIENYFIQEAAYAIMFEERTGIPITQLVTIMLVDSAKAPLVFIEHRDSWASELVSAIEDYRKAKLFGHA